MTDTDPKAPLQGVASAASVLVALTSGPQGVRELARRLELTPSSTHRILTSLEPSQLVEFDPETNTYGIGTGVLTLYAGFQRGRPLLARIQKEMRTIVARTQETLELLTIRDDQRTVLLSEEPATGLRFGSGIGTQSPLNAGAAGRVLLEQLSDEELESYFERTPLRAVTPHSLTDRAELVARVRAGREAGYQVSRSEGTVGVAGVAVAIPGTPLGPLALGIFGPVERFTDELVTEYVALLRGVVQKAAPGYSPGGGNNTVSDDRETP